MYFFQNLLNGIDVYEFSNLQYVPHLHESVELVYIENGTTELNVDGKNFEMESNSLSIVYPYQIHSFCDKSEDITGYILFCTPQELKELSNQINGAEPTCPIITSVSDEIVSLIKNIANEHINNKQIKSNAFKTNATELFKKVLPLFTLQHKSNTSLTTTQILLNYCYNNFKEPLTLDGLAKELNINKFYISHIFNNKINLGFTDYLAILRVDEAKKLLKNSNTSITNIAYDVGFSTIRSFNRRFKEFCKITPKEYRFNN